MSHLNSQIKGGYYPFPAQHLPALASLFTASGGGLVLDPCAGEGDALAHLAEAWAMTPYANELDPGRAAACTERFGRAQAVCGDLTTLRAPGRAFGLVYVNPPYSANTGHAEEKRREFEHLKAAWKWAADSAFVIWVVYAHHVTRKAADFLTKHASSVDVYRVPGLHLDHYAQVVVVAKVRRDPQENPAAAEALAASCADPDSLPLLSVLDQPRYRIPAPIPPRRFYFHPDDVTADLMLPFLKDAGAQMLNAFRTVVDAPPAEPPLTPVVPPRGGQLGLILAAGLFNGLLLDTDSGPAAVRGVVRMTQVDTTPEELRGVRETVETRAQVTVTLLGRDGTITRIESGEKDRLVAFLSKHRDALLAHLTSTSQPLYDFNHDRYTPVFDRVFRNRLLPGRPVTGLFSTQKHVVAAMLEALYIKRRVILIGAMGTGKTAMAGTAIAALWDEGRIKPGQVAVIMCPPHLVHKWHDELRDVIPGCVPHVADKDLAKGETLVQDVAAFMDRAAASDKLHILIVSRERMKLGEGWSPAYQVKKRRSIRWRKGEAIPRNLCDPDGNPRPGVDRIITETIPICPTCSTPISSSQDGKGSTEPVKWMSTSPRTCHACGGALWQLTRTFSAPDPGQKFPKRNPRYPVASLLRQRYADRIAVATIDELHETKSIATDQGRAMQDLVTAADYAIGLTGTLFGGMASSVFWLEWAFNPRMPLSYPIDEGIEPAVNRWVRTMGVMVKVIEYKRDVQSGHYNGTDRHEHRPQEAPGISPLLISELLDHCIWVGLPDLAFDLPGYEEIPVPVDLPDNIQQHYDREKAKLLDYLIGCKNEGDATFLGSYLQAVLRYPSTCHTARPVWHRTMQKDASGERITHLVTTLKGFGEDELYPKEEALIDLLRTELAAGRPCTVFIAQSGKLRLQDRLIKLIGKHLPDAKPVILESNTVPTDKRDRWLKKQVKDGANVLICNPRLVETGLDLLDFKSLIWYEVAYSLYTVQQASRRHWRVGQTDDCKVFHIYYTATMEEQAIQLVSEKGAAAALLGGDADGGGLAQLSGGSASLEAELARTVAAGEGVVDASALFRSSAKASADFTSGWANGAKSDVVPTVIPLENIIGKRYYARSASGGSHAHEVVDYGPLDQAAYRVRDLVTDTTVLVDAETVLKAKAIAADLPLELPAPKAKAKPAPVAVPRVPVLTAYHHAKAEHPAALVVHLTERYGQRFAALYGEDARAAAAELGLPLDHLRLDDGARIPRLQLKPDEDSLRWALSRLARSLDRPLALVRDAAPAAPTPPAAEQTQPIEEHILPANLRAAYRRYRAEKDPAAITFVEMAEAFVSFDAQALRAAGALHQRSQVDAAPGAPLLRYFSIPRATHRTSFERLRRGGAALIVLNGGVTRLEPLSTPKRRTVPPKRSGKDLTRIGEGQLAMF